MIKTTLKGLSILAMLIAIALPVQSASLGASGTESRIIEHNDVAALDRVVTVQSYSQGGSGRLIPPSVALRRALRHTRGGKVLVVRLRRGNRPIYVVKVKKRGQVYRVRVDARNGRVIGY